jgi:predicted dienelactone hydrolase
MALRVVLRSAALSLILLLGWTSACLAGVGFQAVSVSNGTSTPIPVAIWYPTDAPESAHELGLFTQSVAPDAPIKGRALRLIVMSHGNGGSNDGHYDTALALAKAGFVVAALEHTGDNYHDQSRATDVANRPRELHRLIDYMLTEWPDHAALDPHRVGAFGFSSGGFTVLAAAGGEPDLTLIAAHCAAHPEDYDCSLVRAHGSPDLATQVFVHDRRIRALVVAAPALGFTFAHGLSSVTQPMQLWRADDDHVLPAPDYADAVRKALPSPPEFHSVAKADHFDFLAPCSDALAKVAPMICPSAPGFDRAAFHVMFDKAVVTFFEAHLH